MLYHYTSREIYNKIDDDGFIRTSWPRLKDHPKGVYLTDLPPNTNKNYLIQQLYGSGQYTYERFIDRTQVCMVIKDHRLDFDYIRENVYVSYHNINLERYLYEVRFQ